MTEISVHQAYKIVSASKKWLTFRGAIDWFEPTPDVDRMTVSFPEQVGHSIESVIDDVQSTMQGLLLEYLKSKKLRAEGELKELQNV